MDHLCRIGRAAIRLDQVVSIKRLPSEPGEPPAVRVYFAGCRSVAFHGDDARAIGDYIDSLPEPEAPEITPFGRPEASVSTALDPKTGKPLRRRDGGDRVTGA